MNNSKKFLFYSDLFWLFMVGSVLGVIIEGVFCIFRYGHWETHTVAVIGPFCILYGIAAVVLYVGALKLKDKNKFIQFIAFSAIATAIEYICGAFLKYGLGMTAWNYKNNFLNLDGLICLKFSIYWGIGGILFSMFLIKPLNLVFEKMHSRKWNISCICLSAFMAVNLGFTTLCIVRWSERHYYNNSPHIAIVSFIDENWNDIVMQKRFCEWKFVE